MISERLDRELLHVARSLCEIAAAWSILGSADKAAYLVEQASDLLTERARHLAAQLSPAAAEELQ